MCGTEAGILTSRGDLNIVCFRIYCEGLNDKDLNELNIQALSTLQIQGKALPSHTWLDGRFAIRVAINNHRTSLDDLRFLVSELEAYEHEDLRKEKNK